MRALAAMPLSVATTMATTMSTTMHHETTTATIPARPPPRIKEDMVVARAAAVAHHASPLALAAPQLLLQAAVPLGEAMAASMAVSPACPLAAAAAVHPAKAACGAMMATRFPL